MRRPRCPHPKATPKASPGRRGWRRWSLPGPHTRVSEPRQVAQREPQEGRGLTVSRRRTWPLSPACPLHPSLPSATSFFHLLRIPADPPRLIRRAGHSSRSYGSKQQEVLPEGRFRRLAAGSRAAEKGTPSANQVTAVPAVHGGRFWQRRLRRDRKCAARHTRPPAGNNNSRISSGRAFTHQGLVGVCVPVITARFPTARQLEPGNTISDANSSAAQHPACCRRQLFVPSDSGSSPEALITLRIARRTVRISSSLR